jgi:hypothetical protein
MSEEQREILQMVSDGKISADDGAKLLEALEKGNQKRREIESPARRVKEKKRMMRENIGSGHITGLDGLRDIGRMVRGIVKDSVSGNDDEFVEIDEDIFEDAELLEGSIELEEGTKLVLKRPVHRRSRKSGGDLVLNGVEGSILEVIGDNTPNIRLYRDNGTVYLKWDKGDLSLNIPETVGNIKASITGGNITLNSISATTDIKTMGGDISLNEVSRAFRSKTMGGNILIRLTDDWNEDSKVTTMGGNIILDICESTKAEISAKTMGGEISVQDDISGLTESGHPGSSRVNIDLTDGDESPELRIKTMGGNISIVRSGKEPVKEKYVEEEKQQKNEEMRENE